MRLLRFLSRRLRAFGVWLRGPTTCLHGNDRATCLDCAGDRAW